MNPKAEYKNKSMIKLSIHGVRKAVALLALLPVAAWARGVVTNCTESALRAAIAGGGVVTFVCDGTIALASTLTNATDLVVDGTGHQVTISGGNAVRVFWVSTNTTLSLVKLTIANGASSGGTGILNAGGAGILNSGGTVNATNCTFSDNTATNQSAGYGGYAAITCGGAIFNGSGLLQLLACNFAGNQACGVEVSGYGGASGAGGAIYNQGGTVLLDLCTFTGNGASGAPATYPPIGGSGSGGAIFNNGTLEVKRTAFAGNGAYGAAAGAGGLTHGARPGDGNGGAICNVGTLLLDSSTLEGNSATGGTGGIGADGYPESDIATDGGVGGTGGLGAGGGLFNRGTATAVNSTFASNLGGGGRGGTGGSGGTGQLRGGNGGPGGTGGSGYGAIYDAGELLHLTNCTLGLNSGGDGPGGAGGMGGGHLASQGRDGYPGLPGSSGRGSAGGIKSSGCLLVNTLLATNSVNCSGWVTDGGYNLSSDGSCAFTALGSLNNVDPKLSPVAENGGPTLTMALLPGSPAIDGGNTSLAPATDQRGFPRPAGLAADIGAYELCYPAILRISAPQAGAISIRAYGTNGQACRLLASTDFSGWVPLATNQIGSDGTVLFYDDYAPRSACRLYRLVMP